MSWVSQVTGKDAENHAETQLNAAQAQGQQATNLRNQAAGTYTGMTGQAQADLASILPTQQFVPTPNVPGYNGTQGTYQTVGPTGTDTGGSGYGLLANQGLSQYNAANAALPSLVNQYEAATGLTSNNTTNPYNLTPAQQALLNSQIDTLNNSQTTALNDLNAGYQARGISDPGATAAAQALIRQNYGAAIAGQQATFANNAAATAAGGAENLINYNAGQEQQGTGTALSAIGGIQNVANEGAGGIANIAGQAQNASTSSNAESNQSQAQANAGLGSILQLGGAAAGYALGAPGAGGGLLGGGSSNTISGVPQLGGMGSGSDQSYPTAAAPAANVTPSAAIPNRSTAANTALLSNPFTQAPYGVNAFNGGVGQPTSIYGGPLGNGGQGGAGGYYGGS